jgi:hypothetical protein
MIVYTQNVFAMVGAFERTGGRKGNDRVNNNERRGICMGRGNNTLTKHL